MDGACCWIIGLENRLPVGQVDAVKSGAVNGGDGLFANFEAVTKIDNGIIFAFAIWLVRTATSSRPPCCAAPTAGKFPMLFLVPVNRSTRYKLPLRSVTNKCRSSRKSMPQGCDNGAPIFWINGAALAGIICPPNIVRAMMQRRISLPAK